MSNFKCRKCNETKPIEDFVKDATRSTGHHPYCRTCQNKIKNNKKALSRALKWQKENKDKRVIIRKRWYDNNPELVRIYKAERRLRECNLSDGTISKESLSNLPKDNCSICGDLLDWSSKNSVHLDHIKPLIKGGEHSIGNVQWTCSTCNLEKGGR